MKKELCQYCGASLMANAYTMNKTLVNCMAKMLRAPNQPIRDIGLTKSEYSVISKLKHWGFAYKTEDGLWHVSSHGKDFMMGKIAAPKKINYFRDAVKSFEGECFVWEVLPTEESKQKYREFMHPYLGEF